MGTKFTHYRLLLCIDAFQYFLFNSINTIMTIKKSRPTKDHNLRLEKCYSRQFTLGLNIVSETIIQYS